MTCDCGIRGEHFACAECEMHVGVKSLPCPRCSYFRFDAVQVAPLNITTPAGLPEQPQTLSRKQRRAAFRR